MFTKSICILLIAQSFAKDLSPPHAHHRNKHVSGIPLNYEYYDQLHLPNPHYKINYLYEQRRTNGEPEIDQIEEEIGKYMHYQLFTTTTTTEPVAKIEDETFKEMTDHSPLETPIIVPEPLHQYHEEGTTLPPMPTAPKLRVHHHSPKPVKLSPPITQQVELNNVQNTDVAESHLNHHHFSVHERISTDHRHPHHRLRISPTTTTSETPVEAEANHETEAPLNHASTGKHIYLSPTTHAPSFKSQHAHNNKIRPILGYIKHDSDRLAPKTVYRGRYKFSWDDINDMHKHISIQPKVSKPKENPIPPVPTLSPWYDGYGK